MVTPPETGKGLQSSSSRTRRAKVGAGIADKSKELRSTSLGKSTASLVAGGSNLLAKSGEEPCASRRTSQATTAALDSDGSSEGEGKSDPTSPNEPTAPLSSTSQATRPQMTGARASSTRTTTSPQTAAPAPAPAATPPQGNRNYDSDSEDEDSQIHAPTCGLDLELVQELLKAGEPTVLAVRGRLVSLVLGRTSTGKSTFLQRLSGRALRETPYSHDGNVLKTVFEVEGDPEPGFEIGHASKSRTTTVNHLRCSQVVYVDSPGSLDTRGAEINIATSLSFQQIAQNCRALRLVVLVSCAAFEINRAEDLRSSLDFMRHFVNNWKESRLAFSFLFTHTEFLKCTSAPGSGISHLRAKLRDRLVELLYHTDDLRANMKAVLEWLVKCLKKGWWDKVDVFHPLESNVEEWRLGAEIFEPEYDPKGNPTYHAIGLRPDEECSTVLCCNLDEAAANKIKIEMDFVFASVNKWLRSRDYESLEKQMGVLVYLNEQMSGVSSVKQSAQRIAESIAGHAQALVKEAESIIKSSLDLEGQHVLLADLRKALGNLAAADFLYGLPLRELSAGADVVIDSWKVEEVAKSLTIGLKRYAEVLRGLLGTVPSECSPSLGGIRTLEPIPAASFQEPKSTLEPIPGTRFRQLKCLAAWAEVSEGNTFAGIDLKPASEGASILQNYIQRLLKLLRETTATPNTGFAERYKIRAPVLARLLELGQNIQELLPLDAMTEAGSIEELLEERSQVLIDEATKKLEKALAGVRHLLEQELGRSLDDSGAEATLTSARDSVTELLHLAAAIEPEKITLASLHSTCQRGLAAVDDLAKFLVLELDSPVRDVCQAVPSNGPFPDIAEKLACLLSSLKMVLEGSNGGSSLESRDACKALLTRYLDSVELLSRGWESKLADMWNEANRPKMTAIDEQVQLLGSLSQATWKDRYVSSPSSPLVADLLQKYSKFVLEHSQQVLEGMDALLKTPMCPTARDQFVQSLKEGQLLQAFSRVCPALPDDWAKTEKGLLVRLCTWKDEKLAESSFETMLLTSVLAKPTGPLFTDIEAISHVWEALAGLKSLQAKMQAVHKKAGECLKWLQKEVDALLTADGKFEAKKLLLEALRIWDPSNKGQQGSSEQDILVLRFAHICEDLPSSEEVICYLQREVTKHSEKIKGLISTDKLDDAAEAIASFEPAICMDDFLRDTVKYGLDILKERLDMRRSDLDAALEAQINECDFEGLKTKLEDMLKSESNLGKQKAKEVWQRVEKRVNSLASEAKANIQDGAAARSAIQKLRSAIFELDPFIKKFDTSRKMQSMADSVEQQINHTFEGIVEAIKTAPKLSEALVQQQRLLTYHSTTALWLKSSLRKKAEQALDSVGIWAKKQLDSAGHLADSFVKNLDLEPEGRTNTSGLLLMLDELKALIEASRTMKAASNEVDTTQLKPAIDMCKASWTYNRVVHGLAAQLTTVRNQCQLPSSDPRVVTRVRCLYPYLIREFQEGLAKHVRLDFCLETELEQAEKQHSERKSRLSIVFSTKQEMERAWGDILSQWEGISGTFNTFWHRRAYSSDMDDLAKQACRTINVAIDALTNSEYPRCRNQSMVALAMLSLLKGHPPALDRVAAALDGLKRMVEGKTAELVQDLLKALSSNHTSELERLFFRLHKLVKQLRDPFPRILERLPILHTRLFQHVISKVGSLDDVIQKFHLQKVKQSVQTLRDFGHVLVSIWPVYAEYVRDFSHGEFSFNHLNAICCNHFSGPEFKRYGWCYAALEIDANATKKDVERAFRFRSRECHPDKKGGQGTDDEQKLIAEAKSILSDDGACQAYQRAIKELFSSELREIPSKMRVAVQASLDRGDYVAARSTLVATRDLQLVSTLVELPLDNGLIERIVKQHLDQLRNDINTFWSNRQLKQLNSCLERLQKVDSAFRDHPEVYSPDFNRRIQEEVRDRIDADSRKVSQKIDKLASEGEDHFGKLQIAEGLLSLGSFHDEIALFKDHTEAVIGHLLTQCQDELGPKFIFRIGLLLGEGKVGKPDIGSTVNAESKRIGLAMLESFQHFRTNLTAIFNQQTSTQRNVDHVLGNIRTHNMAATTQVETSVDPLRSGFQAYKAYNDELLTSWNAGYKQLEDVKVEVEKLAAEARPLSVHNWTSKFRQQLPKILAGIAAYFTITKSTAAAAADADILQRPHTVQILAILTLFGYNSPDTVLARQLVQIRTGEGKSMILGMSSLLFALLGFRVHCICYSKFLSERDHKLFHDIFKAFRVQSRVHYSTISDFKWAKLAEKGDIQQMTSDLVQGKLGSASSRPQVEPTHLLSEEILLVDEVDMFFGTDFYGQTYNSVSYVNWEDVCEMLKMIWRHWTLPFQELLAKVHSSRAFKRLSQRMSGFEWLLDREARRMCQDVHRFDPAAHVFDKSTNQIGYKDFDSINYNYAYGYTTAFAYIYETEQGRLQDPNTSLERWLSLLVYCGNFCYSSIDADCIVGVSGTLEALGDEERKIMRKYGIDRYSVMPSIYGEYNFSWKSQNGIDPLSIVQSREAQFVQLTKQINSLVVDCPRAVIVVFETLELLRQYDTSPHCNQVWQKNLLIEDMSQVSKEFAIRKAATLRQVTLTTKAFGRGMDFMCHDDRLVEAGGTHLIATFFPLDRSEERQIQGRIARQGKPGSYSMLLCEPDLVSSLGWKPAATMGQRTSFEELYWMLDAQRAKQLRKKFERLEDKLEKAEKEEKMSQAYFDALLAGNVPKSKRLLEEYYRQVQQADMS